MRLALPTRFRDALQDLPAGLEIAWYTDGADCPSVVPGAEVLWMNHGRPEEIDATLEAGDRLRWISSHGAGMDRMPLTRLRERRIQVTNGASLCAIPIAEYVVMAALAAAKGFPALVHAQDRTEWLRQPPAFGELHGTRALIIGSGGIGQAIAERLRPFGVEVIGVRRRRLDGPGVIGPEDWRPRLGDFDWVILATPLTTETRHLLGAAELAAMKPTAWVLNISRGGLIDDQALIPALRGGVIGGAYLDATDPEPLPAESELWRLPNVMLTPHASWASNRFPQRAAELFLDNLARYRGGEPLRNLVDLEAGY